MKSKQNNSSVYQNSIHLLQEDEKALNITMRNNTFARKPETPHTLTEKQAKILNQQIRLPDEPPFVPGQEIFLLPTLPQRETVLIKVRPGTEGFHLPRNSFE